MYYSLGKFRSRVFKIRGVWYPLMDVHKSVFHEIFNNKKIEQTCLESPSFLYSTRQPPFQELANVFPITHSHFQWFHTRYTCVLTPLSPSAARLAIARIFQIVRSICLSIRWGYLLLRMDLRRQPSVLWKISSLLGEWSENKNIWDIVYNDYKNLRFWYFI